MPYLKDVLNDLRHIFFPHICAGCGTDIIDAKAAICLRCLDHLPLTHFHSFAGNLTEKHFFGRLPVTSGSSLCYFTKGSLVRRLLHQLKYKGHRELGYFLGKLIGHSLQESGRFNNVEALIPLPLFPAREKKRGYNQAGLLCEGMASVMQLPVFNGVIKRKEFTNTQTMKSRIERWQNVEGRFELADAASISNRHLLLVDDVITTGATLEACGQQLLQAAGVRLSIATLACAIK